MTRDTDDPAGRAGLRNRPARRPAVPTRLQAVLLMLLLSAAPASSPRPTLAQTVGPLQAPGAASLQEMPPGQRTEQDCGRCHRIEDRRQAPLSRDAAVMT